MVSHLPMAFEILRQPLLRSALSGFGLVHLVWCMHDLTLFLRTEVENETRRRGRAPAGPGESL